MKRLKWIAGGVAGFGAVAAAWRIVAMRRQSRPLFPIERRSEPDPEALQVMMNGGTKRIGMNLERLQALNPEAYQPLVEYLTYIQIQRGEDSSLVFVRQRDIDSLAEMLHETKEEFMERFQKLGVMLSMN